VRRASVTLFAAILVLPGASCASLADEGEFELGSRGGSSSSADDGEPGAFDAGGFPGIDLEDAAALDPTTEQSPDEESCGATTVEAEEVMVEELIEVEELVEEEVEEVVEVEVEEEVPIQVPVAIYLMLDQSWSMVPLWPGAFNSITAFVNDPVSAGINVAIQYFPDFAMVGQCNGTGYDVPEVPMGELPAHAVQITDSLASHGPVGIGTPTEGGLRGATMFCKNYQQQNPDVRCVAVLITDGAPSSCDQNHDNLVNIAAQAFADGVMTFAVGLAGADFVLLNRIAQAGGGEDCDPGPQYACDVTADAEGLVDPAVSGSETSLRPFWERYQREKLCLIALTNSGIASSGVARSASQNPASSAPESIASSMPRRTASALPAFGF